MAIQPPEVAETPN